MADVSALTFSPDFLKKMQAPKTGYDKYKDIVDRAAETYGVDKSLIRAVGEHESGGTWDPNIRGTSGEIGAMQIMPETGRALGVTDRANAEQNIMGGAKLLKQLSDQFEGDVNKVLIGYNAGPGAVLRDRVPETTRVTYVPKVTTLYAKLKAEEQAQAKNMSFSSDFMNKFGTPETPTQEPESAQNFAPRAHTPVKSEGTVTVGEPTVVDQSKRPSGASGSFELPGDKRDMVSSPLSHSSFGGGVGDIESIGKPLGEDTVTDALVAGAVSSTPVAPFLPKKALEKLEETKQKDPIAGTIGEVGGTIGQAIVGGGLIAKGVSKLPLIANNSLLKAAIPRVVTSLGMAGVKGARDVKLGKQTLKEAMKDVAQAGGAGAISMIPEVLAPAGAWQLLAQPMADLVYDMGVDKLRGKDVGSAEWWKGEAINLAMSLGFAIKDVSSGKTFKAEQLRQREDLKDMLKKGKIEFVDFPRFKEGEMADVHIKREIRKMQTEHKGEAPDVTPGTGEVRLATQKDLPPGKKLSEGLEAKISERPSFVEGETKTAPDTEAPERPTRQIEVIKKETAQRVEPTDVPKPTPEVTTTETRQLRPTTDDPATFKSGQKAAVLENEKGSVAVGGGKVDDGAPPTKKPGLIKRFAQKWFGSKGLMPDKAFESNVRKDGRINNYLRDIEKTAIKFDKSVKQAFNGAKLTDENFAEIDQVLKGERSIDTMPEQMRPVLNDMRTQIDALSQRMIDEGMVEGDLKEVVSDNLGFYATRSYRVFDDPKWANKVPLDVRNNAKAFIRQEYEGYSSKRSLDIDNKISKLQEQRAGLTTKEADPNAPVDEKILAKRKEVDEEIDRSVEKMKRAEQIIKKQTDVAKKVLEKRLFALNEEKTKVWRERPVGGDEKKILQKKKDALQRKIDKLTDDIEEIEGLGDIDDDMLSILDELQGNLAEVKGKQKTQPLRQRSDETPITLFNAKIRDILSIARKLDTKEGAQIEAAFKIIQKNSDRVIGKINDVKQTLYRAPTPETQFGAKTTQEEIADIDTKLDELVAEKGELTTTLTEEQLEGRINNLLYKEGAPVSLLSSGGKLGSKNLAMLKRRKEIPAQIRALWGEYKNADVNYARSVSKMAHALENNRFLNEVLEEGKGKFFFDEPLGENSVKIAADESSAMSPLNGKFTTKEIKEAFEDATKSEVVPGWLRLMLTANSSVKYAKTIGSAMTHVRNTTGNVGFAIANGHFNVKHMPDAFKATFGDVVNATPQKLEAEIRTLIELGVLSDGARAGELKSIIKDASGGNIDVLVGKGPKKALQKALKFGEKLYGAEDDVWKFFAYRNELARYKQALPDMDSKELSQKVATIVRNTYPTYSMVPRAIKMLRRFPLLGTFVSFPWEVARTALNTIGLAKVELSDPALRKIGAQRLAGMTLAATMTGAATIGSRFLTGTTRKKEDAQREFLPPWSENSQIIHLGSDDKNNYTYIDLGFSDPHSYLKKPVIAFMRGEKWQDKVVDAVGETFAPFISEDILAQKLIDIKRNKSANGQPIYNEEGKPGDIAWDWTKYIAEAFEPGTISGLQRMYKATQNKEGKAGTNYDLKTEAIAQGTGVRISKTNTPRSLAFKTFKFNKRLRNASRLAKKEGLKQSFEQTKKVYDDFSKTISAAYTLGMTKGQIYKSLRENMSKPKATALLNGTYDSYLKKLFNKKKEESR